MNTRYINWYLLNGISILLNLITFLHNFKKMHDLPFLMLLRILWPMLSDCRCFVPVTISLVITGIRLYDRSIWFSRYGIHYISDEKIKHRTYIMVELILAHLLFYKLILYLPYVLETFS